MHKSQQQQKAATHSLRFENVSAACITCTAECTVVQRGLKFKCTWSKHSVCTAPQMCVCIVKLNNLCVCLCVNTVPLVLRSVIFSDKTLKMEKSGRKTPPKLVEIISERYNVSLSEAFEILVKVK